MADAFIITIQPCDRNHVSNGNVARKVASQVIEPQDNNTPTKTVVIASSAQIRGIMGYVAAVNAGATTTSIESAVTTALT